MEVAREENGWGEENEEHDDIAEKRMTERGKEESGNQSW